MSDLMSVEEFQVVEAYKDKGINIPKRATRYSAGYDIEAAEDIIVPSIFKKLKSWEVDREDMSDNLVCMWRSIGYFEKQNDTTEPKSISEIKTYVKSLKLVTMIPTGLKIAMNTDKYLALHPRSSMGVNCLLMLANQTGIIDADYYNNEDNEGHIFVPMINLSPYDIKINKGDRIAQGIVQRYATLEYADYMNAIRIGGCGSTGVNDVIICESDGAKSYTDTDEAKIEVNPYRTIDSLEYIPKAGEPIQTLKIDPTYRPEVTHCTVEINPAKYNHTVTTKAPDYSTYTKISTADYPQDPDVVTIAEGNKNE